MSEEEQTQGGESLYSLYRRGMELLEDGDFEEATVPLKEAARQAPEKSSVREALGRALFRSRHYAEAATEFEAVVETHPVNDYAHFCLGRALTKTGETRRARHHLALASNLRPDRRDYRIYRERLAAASGKMNEPLGDREILCVSQFTLYGDTRKGNRPSYVEAAPGEQAESLYDRFCERAGAKRGVFGACMGVALINDGP